MNDLERKMAEKVLGLRKIFAHHEAYQTAQAEFSRLLERRRVEIRSELTMEARGLVLIGASGSGKTTAVARMLSHTPSLVLSDPYSSTQEVVSFQVPSPATLKFVGQTALYALGYPMQRDRTEMIVWGMVSSHLKARKTLFFHLDEAQDLMRHQTPKMLQSVVRTLKSLMQADSWPVGLILSGTYELKELLNSDPQLARRFYPVEFPRVNPQREAGRIIALTKEFCARSQLESDETLLGDDFSGRLAHAGAKEFGIIIELIIGAIEEAIFNGSNLLKLKHFERAFQRRTGCIAGLNPFLATEYERIDARLLLQSATVL